MGIIVSPQKYIEVLAPSTCECDLFFFLEIVFAGVIEIKLGN